MPTDYPKPWRYEENNRTIFDAKGKCVMFSLDSHALAKKIVANINATPDELPLPKRLNPSTETI